MRLSGANGEIIGSAKSLQGYPGDTIYTQVYSKYFAPTTPNTSVVGNIAAAMADAFELTTGTAEVQPALEAINALFQAGPYLDRAGMGR